MLRYSVLSGLRTTRTVST